MLAPFDVHWLTAAVGLATPLILASSGELISQRTGVMNIGLEGMMLSGAFFAFLGTYLTGSVLAGVLIGMAAGAVIAAIMALLAVRFRADQIVVGVGINLLGLGITTFVFREVFGGQAAVQLERPTPVAVPLLSEIPVLGEALFNHTVFVYIAFASVAVVWFVLFRTPWGLAIRATGELPAAADTAGVSVERVRWIGCIAAGAMAALGGAFLSVGRLGLFSEGMSAGRGFLVLAAVILGGWRPLGMLAACLVFGAADALQLRLQAYATIPRQVWLIVTLVGLGYLISTRQRRQAERPGWGPMVSVLVVSLLGIALFVVAPPVSFPSQLWLILPYLLALLTVAGLVGRVRMPAALAIPYRRG